MVSTKPQRITWLAALLFVSAAVSCSAALEVLDATYRPDRVLPEFNMFWKTWKWGDPLPVYAPSGALCIYLRNTGSGAVTINDVTVNGQGLKDGIRCRTDKLNRCDMAACSIFWDGTRQVLADAGDTIWWRPDPNPIPAGGTGEVFIRMRNRVITTLSLVVQSSAGNVSVSIPVSNDPIPRVAGYCTSPDYTQLYLYLRHPQPGKIPTQILIDGVDRTSSCDIVGDSAYDLTAVRCGLGSALVRGTYHCFQAVYDDGSKASDGSRIYYDTFKYGRWGNPPAPNAADAEFHVRDMADHSMNTITHGWGDLDQWAESSAGRAFMDANGIRKINYAATADRLYSIFLCDEIDIGEAGTSDVSKVCPAGVGALSQSMSQFAQSFKSNYSQYPTNLNLDATFKPNNYYIYGHVPDVLSVDPYYQTRILDAYYYRPWEQPLYSKATYIYAVAATCQAACEPHRLHVILNSCRKHENDEVYHRVFRWATPEEKRIEFYYAIAAGAKEIAYWWFNQVGVTADAFCGIGDANEPGSAALWREIGLLGAEGGLASQLLVNGCPVTTTFTKPGKLWIRAMLSGVDTLVLFVVNDDYSCVETGTLIRPVANAEVGLDLPDYINPAGVFEIDYKGTHDVSYDVSGGRINLHLGTVPVTRMVVITGDSTLKSSLQSLYTATYAPRVNRIIAN
jgi:hypothetical protein